MINQDRLQHKPTWERYVLLSDFGNFDEKNKKKTIKNALMEDYLGLKTLKMDQKREIKKWKIQGRLYKFLIKGEKKHSVQHAV